MKEKDAQLHQRSKMGNKLISQIWADPKLRQALMDDPKAVIQKVLGITVPEFIEVEVLQETPKKIYVVLPMNPCEVEGTELTDEELAAMSQVGVLCHITEQQSYGTC